MIEIFKTNDVLKKIEKVEKIEFMFANRRRNKLCYRKNRCR